MFYDGAKISRKTGISKFSRCFFRLACTFFYFRVFTPSLGVNAILSSKTDTLILHSKHSIKLYPVEGTTRNREVPSADVAYLSRYRDKDAEAMAS